MTKPKMVIFDYEHLHIHSWDEMINVLDKSQ